MPLSEYFRGKGRQVMDSMRSRYGDKKGESVFYATANARGMKPGNSNPNGADEQEDQTAPVEREQTPPASRVMRRFGGRR